MYMRSWLSLCLLSWTVPGAALADLDLSKAAIVTSSGKHASAEGIAARVLSEEIASRTGVTLPIKQSRSYSVPDTALIQIRLTPPKDAKGTSANLESFTINSSASDSPVVQVTSPTQRGLLFGVGKLLRLLTLEFNVVGSPEGLAHTSAPAYAIRGHQLGYRHAANSWDAWSIEQFDQHIRELALFGANAIENIPFQDDRTSPLMKVPRDEMNLAMSAICAKYDLDYWVWTPADFDLKDEAVRAEHLKKHEALYKACPRLDAVFFPGGDPGDNDPSLVMPFLEDVAELLHKHHPNAGMWMSLQGFNKTQVDYFYDFINREQPTWFTGVVSGPSSPPIDDTRRRLLPQYKHRHYPDITHCVRAQYPVEWWDPAFGMTLGRECINPRPIYSAALHNFFAEFTDGFLSYSDGVHDDVNKQIWTLRSWDPKMPVRDMLLEYTRFFFGAAVAEASADGILALEKNWEGAIGENGSIDSTLTLWRALDAAHPALREHNWRWQMCLLRANYDAYQRHRSMYEAALEKDANAALLAKADDPAAAITSATEILNRAVSNPVRKDLRNEIEVLCAALFKSVQLQTSVEKYTASGTERGAVLDMVDRPLNNRWWLEDEFKKVLANADKEAQKARLVELATWEDGIYDDAGNISKSNHIVRGETTHTDPLNLRDPNPDHVWKDNGNARERISWMTYMDWPIAARYTIPRKGNWFVKMSGQGDALVRIDGERVEPSAYGKLAGEKKSFKVPDSALEDGVVVVTWDVPDEAHLNWRQRSRLNEIWLVDEPQD